MNRIPIITDNEIRKIKEYRLSLMGIAAVMVVLFHLPLENGSMPDKVHMLLYGGVDIFMFMSGLSMYHSYVLKSNRQALVFYKKRFIRVVPKYITFIIIGFLVDSIRENVSLLSFIYEG